MHRTKKCVVPECGSKRSERIFISEAPEEITFEHPNRIAFDVCMACGNVSRPVTNAIHTPPEKEEACMTTQN